MFVSGRLRLAADCSLMVAYSKKSAADSNVRVASCAPTAVRFALLVPHPGTWRALAARAEFAVRLPSGGRALKDGAKARLRKL